MPRVQRRIAENGGGERHTGMCERNVPILTRVGFAVIQTTLRAIHRVRPIIEQCMDMCQQKIGTGGIDRLTNLRPMKCSRVGAQQHLTGFNIRAFGFCRQAPAGIVAFGGKPAVPFFNFLFVWHRAPLK
jgi:hypothetical protein